MPKSPQGPAQLPDKSLLVDFDRLWIRCYLPLLRQMDARGFANELCEYRLHWVEPWRAMFQLIDLKCWQLRGSIWWESALKGIDRVWDQLQRQK